MLTTNPELATVREEAGHPRRPASGLFGKVIRASAQMIMMIAILAASLLVTLRLIETRPQTAPRPLFPTEYAVETIIAQPGDWRPSHVAYGEIQASRSVELRSLVSGVVSSVSTNLKPGAAVTAGDVLVSIDRFNYEGALREAEANVAETRAKVEEYRARIAIEQNKLMRAQEQLDFAIRDLDRVAMLRSTGSATEKQADDREFIASQRRATVEQTQINLVAEKARLAQQEAALERLLWKRDQARRNLDDTTLVAPFDAVVRSAAAETGRMVGANDVVVTLYEQGSMEARFVLTDERYGNLQAAGDELVGRQVSVRWKVGTSETLYTGRIVRIGAEIAAARGGVEVYARLDDGAGAAIRPGAFVEIEVPDRMFAAHYRIPESAIYGGTTVYAVVDGSLRARPVRIAAYDGDHALIAEGIKAGEEILVTRISEIGEGLRVRPVGGGAAQ